MARSDLSAADAGAPQAKQIVDRFHLQKNFGEALEKFFCRRKNLLKETAQQLGGQTSSPPKTPCASSVAEQESECHHTERVARHKKIWELFRAGYAKGDIARIVGVSLHSVYRA